MPNCMICKEPVASGLVLCGACAGDYVALDYMGELCPAYCLYTPWAG